MINKKKQENGLTMTNFDASGQLNNDLSTNCFPGDRFADLLITIKQVHQKVSWWTKRQGGMCNTPYSGRPCLQDRRWPDSRRDRAETIKTSTGTTFRQIYTVVGCRRTTSDRARFDGGGPMSNLHTMPTGVVRAIYRRQWINRDGCVRGVPRWHGPETIRARQQVVDLFLSSLDTNAFDDDNR